LWCETTPPSQALDNPLTAKDGLHARRDSQKNASREDNASIETSGTLTGCGSKGQNASIGTHQRQKLSKGPMQAKGPDRGNIPDLGKGGKRTSYEISHESHRRGPQVGRALWRRRQKRRRAKCPKSGEDRTLNCIVPLTQKRHGWGTQKQTGQTISGISWE